MNQLFSKTVQFKLWKVALFLFLIGFFFYNLSIPLFTRTYLEEVDDVRFIEHESPLTYIDFGYTAEKNFWGDKFNVSFSVRNRAKVIETVDMTFDLIFFDSNGVELSRREVILSERFDPSSYVVFDKTFDAILNCNSIHFVLKSAIGL